MRNVLKKLNLPDPEANRNYLAWKTENADVLEIIRGSALQLVVGRRRFSIYALVDYVRVKEFIEGFRDEPYRINHNHVGYIARDLRKECPEIDEFIQVRVVRGRKEEGLE